MMKSKKMNNEEENKIERLHVTIEGRVQGVGFRYFVQEQAIQLTLTGWVRNRWDGSVEVMAEGKRDDLEKLLKALARGPRSAHVMRIKSEWQTSSEDFSHFNIRLTA
jgi:acylphosphatase